MTSVIFPPPAHESNARLACDTECGTEVNVVGDRRQPSVNRQFSPSDRASALPSSNNNRIVRTTQLTHHQPCASACSVIESSASLSIRSKREANRRNGIGPVTACFLPDRRSRREATLTASARRSTSLRISFQVTFTHIQPASSSNVRRRTSSSQLLACCLPSYSTATLHSEYARSRKNRRRLPTFACPVSFLISTCGLTCGIGKP